MTNVSQPVAGQVGEIECVLIDSSAKAAYVFLWLRTFFWLFVWVVSESVWHHYWQGSLRLISASVFLFICVHWAMFKAALELVYTCSRRCAKQLRWFWRGRGRCRGGCIVKIGRISRPDQSKKARRRGGERRKGRAEEPRNIPEEHRSRARPVLETDVLPPPRSQENITVLVCVLFAMNPAIFASCWEDLWQPFICLCIFERTCIAIGSVTRGDLWKHGCTCATAPSKVEVHAHQEPFVADGGKECTENATYIIIIVDGAPVAYKLC